MRLRRLLASCAALMLVAQAARGTEAAPPPESSPAPAPAPRPLWWQLKASIGYHFSTGDYTGTQTTDIQYVPLVVTADVERWRIQSTIPWLYISGPPGIIDGPNGPIQTTNGTSSGLGDLLLRGSYLLPVERLIPPEQAVPAWLPYVELAGLIKFPTASRSQGLGTGEFDFGIDTDLTWTFGPFSPFVSAGYRILGSPPGTHLDDVFTGTVGSLYRIWSSLSGGALLDYRQAPTASTGQRLELVPYVSWVIAPPWTLDSYVSIGLANGSPDFGVGTQLGYTW
jgi:hypothetical protein